MRRQRSSQGGAQSSAAQPMRKTFRVGGMIRPVAVLAIVLLAGLLGCSSRDPAKATSDPVAKVRLTRLLKFYTTYTALKHKPPANEQVFKEYLRTLPEDEKVAAGIVGDDVDSLLVSPRDGQKYHIEYGLVANPRGGNQALAWEETGQDGKRYVALTMGYTKECDEETFQNYKPKK